MHIETYYLLIINFNIMTTQPLTITDLRRNPRSVIAMAEKQGEVPILKRSKFAVVVVSIEKYMKMEKEIDDYRKALFRDSMKKSEEDLKHKRTAGPFKSSHELMKYLNT